MFKKKSSLTDLELWTLIQEGDAKALEIIYYRYYDLMLGYGLRIYPKEEIVKDAIHDLILKIYGNKHLNSVTLIRPYLLRSLRNLLYERISQLVPSEQIESPEAFFISISDENIDKLFAQSDDDIFLSRKLIKAYNQLKLNQRRILYLRYIKELTFKEIADVLEINTQSAMNLASRAITKLRDLLINNKEKSK